ncbi:MAG: (Fe-S)-binding protein [bacterium]
MSVRRAVDRHRAYFCLECGICTGTCPVSRFNEGYSPRLLVERSLLAEKELKWDREIWSCLTCGACDIRCPSGVDYSDFMREIRGEAVRAGNEGTCTHAETIEAMVGIQLMPDYRRSNQWLKGAHTAKRADFYYFAGCLPFLDVIFEAIGFQGQEIGLSSVRMLNALSITPAISEAEVCCGHDAYWTGRSEIVQSLAEKNVKAIRATGARKVVFSCPECYYMFRKVYPEIVGDLGFEVLHITSLVADSVAKLRLRGLPLRIVYHDPCRLAKSFGLTDEPRQIMAAIPQIELLELKRFGAEALCCGSSNWINCSRVNKRIQLEKLEEASATGADVLLTSCPKCNIHLRCAMNDEDCKSKMEITDLMVLVGKLIGRRRNGA